ncbi:MAG: hypothetical protein V3U28_06505 [Candidatus Acidoferrales bacterium]
MPKIASAFSFGIITVAVLLPLARAQTPQQIESQSTVRQQAEEVWEQAIAAKGARERLYEVRNLVISEYFQRKERRYESFYVFPNKLWYWVDDRPSVLGLNISVYNVDSGQAWLITRVDNYQPVSFQIPEGGNATFNFYRIRAQLCFLLETRWVKPVPIKVEKERIGWKKFDVLHAEVEAYGERSYVVFYFDPETHLPSKVGFKDVEDAKYYYWVYMSDYVEISGIQMPRKVGYYRGPARIPITFQFNVEYDEQVFEQPPTVDAGPEAWKVKPRR